MRVIFGVSAVVMVCGIALAVRLASHSNDGDRRAPRIVAVESDNAAPPRERPVVAARDPTGAPAVSPVRAAIRTEVEKAPPKQCSEVDGYLDQLEARARRQRKVTSLEIEPGFAMLREHCGNEADALQKFSQRMLRLQSELEGTEPNAPPDRLEVRRKLDQLMGDVKYAKTQTEKQAAIRKCIDLIPYLEPEEASDVQQELNAVALSER